MVGSGRAPGIGYLRETWGTRGRRRVTVQAGGTARAKALRWELGACSGQQRPVWPEEGGGESVKPQGRAAGALAPALGDRGPLQDFEQAHSGVRGREAGGPVRRLRQEPTGSRRGGRSPTFRDVFQFSSVAKSCPTLQPHGLQHTRLPCPSPTPGACSNSCPSSW